MSTLSPPPFFTWLSSPTSNKSFVPPSVFSSNQSSTLSTNNPSCCGRDTICLPSISDHITSPGMPESRVKFSKYTWGLTVALSTHASVRKMIDLFIGHIASSIVWDSMFVVDNVILKQYIIGKIHQLLEYWPNSCDTLSDVFRSSENLILSGPLLQHTSNAKKIHQRSPSMSFPLIYSWYHLLYFLPCSPGPKFLRESSPQMRRLYMCASSAVNLSSVFWS